jgi:ribose-phosphate pyrophosphokinase
MAPTLYLQPIVPNLFGHELIPSFTFSGGEEHVSIPKKYIGVASITLVSRINSSSDLMKVVLAKDALDRIGVRSIALVMPYIPYARQDRVMEPGEPLSIKVFADIINGCKFSGVAVMDPHSDVSTALINNLAYISPVAFLCESMSLINSNWKINDSIRIVSPDAGAEKKIYNTCKLIGYEREVILCSKHRDVVTREITGTRVNGDVSGKTCVIIDDICDGGRTFVALASELKSLGAIEVFLVVTHGIFSHGEEQLKGIDHIYSTNSVRSYESNLITFIPF